MTEHALPVVIDLHDEVFAICDKLGLDPQCVREITLDPQHADVLMYQRDENGEYAISPSSGKYKAVTYTRRFHISTHKKVPT